MVRDREVESLRLTATDFESVVAAITPIPHIYLKPTSFRIAISSTDPWMMYTYDVLSRQKIHVAKAYPNTQHNA